MRGARLTTSRVERRGYNDWSGTPEEAGYSNCQFHRAIDLYAEDAEEANAENAEKNWCHPEPTGEGSSSCW